MKWLASFDSPFSVIIWQGVGALLSIYVFNIINIRFPAEHMSFIYFAYGTAISFGVFSAGFKDFYSSRNPLGGIGSVAVISIFGSALSMLSMFFFFNFIGDDNIGYGEFFETTSFIFIFVFYFFFNLSEIFGNSAIARGSQWSVVMSRLLPPLFLLLLLSTELYITWINFFSTAIMSFVVILLGAAYILKNREKNQPEPAQRSIDVLVEAIFYSAPIVGGSLLAVGVLNIERSLWLQFGAVEFIAYQAYLMLYGVFVGGVVFPIINRFWADMREAGVNRSITSRFMAPQSLCVSLTLLYCLLERPWLDLVFGSFTQNQLSELSRILVYLGLLMPLLGKRLLIGRFLVSIGDIVGLRIVELFGPFVSFIAALLFSLTDLWPGYLILQSIFIPYLVAQVYATRRHPDATLSVNWVEYIAIILLVMDTLRLISLSGVQ